MERDRAIVFASLMQMSLNIPSMVCEIIEEKLVKGCYEEVVNFAVDRWTEISKKYEVKEVE